MSIRTGVVSGDSLRSLNLKTIKSTQNHFKKMKSGGHFFCFKNKTLKCQGSDIIRWLSEMSSDALGGLTLRNLLLNSLVSTENKQSSSGIICMTTLLTLLDQYVRYQPLSSSELNEIEKDLSIISKFSYRASSNEILNVLSSAYSDEESRQIANEAIKLAGANGTIHIDPSSSEKTLITKVNGYNFPITLPDVFLSASGMTIEKRYDHLKICVIDGLIEKVSEINGLIQKSYEEKQPLILVSRGYGDDVQNTLGVNFSSGNLSIIPALVPYDAFGANLINDIATVSGTDIVSSLKGDIISAVDWSELPTIEKARINPKKLTLTIINSRTDRSVRVHRKYLRDKKENTAITMSSEVFDQRLACLVGHGVIVSLGRDLGDSWGITKDRVESYIRSFRDASRFGLINIDKTVSSVSNSRIRMILETISKDSNIVISRALLVGLKIGINTTNSIGRVGGIVYIDR